MRPPAPYQRQGRQAASSQLSSSHRARGRVGAGERGRHQTAGEVLTTRPQIALENLHGRYTGNIGLALAHTPPTNGTATNWRGPAGWFVQGTGPLILHAVLTPPPAHLTGYVGRLLRKLSAFSGEAHASSAREGSLAPLTSVSPRTESGALGATRAPPDPPGGVRRSCRDEGDPPDVVTPSQTRRTEPCTPLGGYPDRTERAAGTLELGVPTEQQPPRARPRWRRRTGSSSSR